MTTENLPNPVVRLGTSLVLRCSVDAPRDVKFQWAVNSIPVTSSGRFQIESDPVSGTSILTITSVLLEDLGEARCTVLDPLHVPLSNTLTVTETGQLYLFGDQTSRVHQVGDGQAIRLECPIRSSTEDTRILWFTGSRLLTNSSGVSLYRLENGSAIAELGVASLAEDEGDQYVCQVREGAISLNYSITIYVTSKREGGREGRGGGREGGREEGREEGGWERRGEGRGREGEGEKGRKRGREGGREEGKEEGGWERRGRERGRKGGKKGGESFGGVWVHGGRKEEGDSE